MAKAKKKNEAQPELDAILRQIIADSGLSQKAIAEAAGISAAQLSRFVRCERSLQLSTVNELAKVLGFTIVKL